MNCDRSADHEILIHHANHRTLGYLHPPHSDFVRRGARFRRYPHWLGLGDSRGCRETSGRKNQERQVYQEACRKRKMSCIISATLTRKQDTPYPSRVRMGVLTPCHESTQIVDSTNDDNIGQYFSPSDTQQVFVQYKNLHIRRIAQCQLLKSLWLLSMLLRLSQFLLPLYLSVKSYKIAIRNAKTRWRYFNV